MVAVTWLFCHGPTKSSTDSGHGHAGWSSAGVTTWSAPERVPPNDRLKAKPPAPGSLRPGSPSASARHSNSSCCSASPRRAPVRLVTDMTNLFEEHAAFTQLVNSVISTDYDLTSDELHALKGCELEAKRRGCFGAGLSCVGAQLMFARNPLQPASIGLTLIGTIIGGYAAGLSSARPCMRNVCALEESLLALEAQRMLALHAPMRCGTPVPARRFTLGITKYVANFARFAT